MEITSDEGIRYGQSISLESRDEYVAALLNAADELRYDFKEQTAYLYGKAAQAGSISGMLCFGDMIKDSVPELASFWFKTAASLGNADGFGYFIELWAEKDQCRAIELVDDIIETNNADLISESACQLEEVNINIAIMMHEKAATLGDARSPCCLAELLLKKSTRNKDEAISLYELAIERGYSPALIELADLIINEDPERAADLYEQALEPRPGHYANPEAAAKLARLVGDKDPERALSCYEQIMESICVEAKNDYADAIALIDLQKAADLWEDAGTVILEDRGFDYCCIAPINSGLPVPLLISDRGCAYNHTYNPPRVVVLNNDDGTFVNDNSFEVSISHCPKVLKGTNKLTGEDWNKVKDFIARNYDVLFDHWIHADEQGSMDVFENLFPERYEKLNEERNEKIQNALRMIAPGDTLEALIERMLKCIERDADLSKKKER